MRNTIINILLALALIATFPVMANNPKVLIETSVGNITLELDAEKAPKTVENFLAYADEGFYQGTVFHRVIDGFMIQGGGFTPELDKKDTRAPVENEADNGLKNLRGTIAMARTNQPHSATAQFFINLVDNGMLDFREKNRRGWGYCAFGKVVDGMDVVDKIAKTTTTSKTSHIGMPMRDVPIEPPVIKKVSRIDTGADSK